MLSVPAPMVVRPCVVIIVPEAPPPGRKFKAGDGPVKTLTMGTAKKIPIKKPKATRVDTMVLLESAPAARIIAIQMKVLNILACIFKAPLFS